MSDDAMKQLRTEYLKCFAMRNWITSKLPKLTKVQLETIYNMLKDWTNEHQTEVDKEFGMP